MPIDNENKKKAKDYAQRIFDAAVLAQEAWRQLTAVLDDSNVNLRGDEDRALGNVRVTAARLKAFAGEVVDAIDAL